MDEHNTQRNQRIARMEQFSNECQQANDRLQEALDRWRKILPRARELTDYYYSDSWRQDVDAFNAGNLPEDLACGVLCEDTIYDLYGDFQNLSLDMLEAAVQWLRPEEEK